MIAAFLGLALLAPQADASAAPVERPNIVFIFSDDHAEAAVSACGSEITRTPRLDELAARLRALVRRSHGQAQERLRCGGLELEPASRRAPQPPTGPQRLPRPQAASPAAGAAAPRAPIALRPCAP